jgi:uncharacterized protein YkwD
MDARGTSRLSLLALFVGALVTAAAVVALADVATAKTLVTLGHLRSARHARHAASYPAAPPPHTSTPASSTASSWPCRGALDIPNAGNLAEVESATLCLVNAVRAHFGVRPLADNAALHSVAVSHSRDMVASDYFDHTSPSGTSQLDLVRSSGYLAGAGTWTVGENLGYGTQELSTPAAMVIAWFFSAEHRANMLSSDYRDTGIGVVAAAPASETTDRPAATYTEEFGTVTP